MRQSISTINQALADQLSINPDATAISHRGKSLSYIQLDKQASQIARQIFKRHCIDGIGDKTLMIPFCLEPGIKRIELILAFLKLGAAYVPIDPEFPDIRIRYILDDIQSEFVYVDSANAKRIRKVCESGDSRIKIIDIDEAERLPDGALAEIPEPSITPTSLAYIMYTSGTTGNPKGVMIPHQGITRLVVDPNYINIQTDDCIAQLANISFDAATFEIWGALLNGACIVVIDKKTALDTAKLSKVIADNKITIMFLTTVLFNQHTNCDPKCYKGLRYLLFGGEAASVNSVRALYQSEDRPENLIHVYGPTENTTFSTFYRVDSMPAAGEPLPIGSSISNTTSFVVDSSMQIIDDHQQGELLLGGKGLALGYLNNHDLTDEKFFSPPWSEELFYKTGDIVGQTGSGSYFFIGRTDNQVKIRGFRIELEEIELALDSHPHIEIAIVVPVDEGAWGTKQLVAYLSASGETGLPELGEIRSWLKGVLPGYMIPSRFYEVSEVPLSPTGKVHRSALSPSMARLVTDQTVNTGALTDIERVIRDLWAGSLHYSPEEIRLDDNFFELGGDSLLSVQIAHEIRVVTGVELPVADLFENPTVKSLAESVLSHSKTKSTPMARWNGKGLLSLSPYQEQIWLHQHQDPNAPFYNEPLSITMHEEIDVDSLKLAIYHLIERHQALRTRIIIAKRGVMQHFAKMDLKRFDDEFNYFDLRHLPIDVAGKEAVIQATRQAIRVFDLENDQLIRFTLVRFAQKSFKLFMTAHHLIIDGVAIYRVFLPELHHVYHALITGSDIGLSDFDFSYADWLLWIDRAQELMIEKHAPFWKKQLDGVTSVQLPTDNLHTANNTFSGEIQCLAFPADMVSLLRNLSRNQGATMFMVMLTAFKVLLKKYTQQNDLTVVTSVANRNLSGTEKFVSDMVNTLLLRTKLPDQGSFKDMLRLVRQTCLQAFSHQQISLQQVLKCTGIGNKENNPINVAFVFEPAMNHDNIDWELSQLDIHTSTSKFDLAMELDERGGEIIGRVEYNTGLFEAQTIKRLIDHYKVLLTSIVENPSAPISGLSLLSESEKQQLLFKWNDNKVNYQGEKLLHRIIEKQVDLTPHATAVIFEDTQVTYSELDERANQLANHLLQLGSKPEDMIVVWTDRSIDHIVAIFAVLKSGAAYVPISSEDPVERAAFILEDTNARIVICDSSHSQLLTPNGIHIVDLDSDRELIRRNTAERPRVDVAPENLAYMIYTSGSTGKPKGVMIEHRSIADRSHWAAASLRLREGDVSLHLFSLAFDASVVPGWWSLNQGAAVLIPSNKGMQNPDYLGHVIVTCGVTTICATPSIMTVVVREIEKREYAGIRYLMTGGEPLSTELAVKMQELAFRVDNYYGPTEATVLATAWSPGMDKLSKPTIGIPVANTPVYVLDDNQQPVPVGIPGELYIGGSGVSRGYLNRQDLTEEFFRNDPFSDDPTDRVYRTGDIVRHLPMGEIEFIGRADKQIKIRGFRIELGEIEAVVRQQSGVKDCVAITRENDSGQKQIIVYLQSESQNPETYDMHETISSLLPPHMVPAGFITLAEFPLTANGKVDITALQDIEFDSSIENNYVAPQSEIEQQIHNIWCEVIGRKKISIEDNFYHTGGDSLLSIQVVCLASDRGLEFSISEMFEFPTIASISKRLAARKHAKEFTNASLSFLSHKVQQLYGKLPGTDTQESSNDFLQSPKPVIKLKDGTLPAIFLIHPAGGSALCYRSLATMIKSNRAIYGLESDPASSAENIEDIATEYLTTIRGVQPDGPYTVGGWSFGGVIAFEVVRQLESMRKQIELLVIIDSSLPDGESETARLNKLVQDKAVILDMVGKSLESLAGKEIAIDYKEISRHDPEHQQEWFCRQLVKRRIFSQEVVDTFIKNFLASFYRSTRLLDQYQGGSCDSPILLLLAHDVSSQMDADPENSSRKDPDYSDTSWRTACNDRLTVHIVPGNHETMMIPPHVGHVAGHISLALQSEKMIDRDRGYQPGTLTE